LRYDLRPTDLVGELRLAVDGSPPPQVSLVACRATEGFGSASNGSWSKVPGYDGESCVDGVLDKSDVVFADIGKLVANAQLAVVILPGAIDRVVFKHPDAGSLQVTHAGAVGGAAPGFGSGAQETGGGPSGSGSSGGSGGAAPPQSSVGGSAVVAPPTGDLPSGGAVEAPTDVPAPEVAGTSAPGSPVTQPAAAATVDDGLSTGQRRAIALVVIAAEIVGYVLLSRMSDAGVVPTTGAAGMATGRLRPPDRAVGGWRGSGGGAGTPGGVGRFRREREGPAPQL
jgi:hypothetical protein